METLASFWSRDPCDAMVQSHEASALWDAQSVESSAPAVSCALWTELSPHLQRNKQLHDTLLQREEELARLQEENHKLRQFLNSSFVKELEEKAKKLCADGRRKRSLSSSGAPISKRVCRNLTAEFCSESEPSEPYLDLWVLKTLGLKDKDTIDTRTDHNIPIDSPMDGSSTSCNVYLSPVTANVLQTAPSPSGHQHSKDTDFENSYLDCSTSQEHNSPCFRFQTTPGHSYLNEQSPNTSFAIEKSQFVEQQGVCRHSPPLQTTINYSPLKRLHFSCSTAEKSGTNQNGGIVPSPLRCPRGPGTPDNRSDLAFSMSLSPNHSVKTHSFPHGQAFVRRDTQGRCNFTWVPRDRP